MGWSFLFDVGKKVFSWSSTKVKTQIKDGNNSNDEKSTYEKRDGLRQFGLNRMNLAI